MTAIDVHSGEILWRDRTISREEVERSTLLPGE